ncbi:PepSY-associated TM helix domain-containing protein [Myxococcota bacterium]|nr:PepSY-associated TM helix domain-containing protein [Myxococcota bacterium]
MTHDDAATPAPTHEPKKKGWRRWNRVLHRDAGYLATGLTLIYAISGVVVNHTNDINPNYVVEREEKTFEPVAVSDRDTMVAELVKKLALPGPPKESFRPSPEKVDLFYEDFNVKADATAGTATIERSTPRFLIKDMNTLHLNRLRGAWTWIADAYAIVLAFLAISGMIMLKGKDGFMGRGKWFVLAGFAVPILYLALFD